MKKILSIFILIAVAVAQIAFVLPALSVKTEAIEAENECGIGVRWHVDTISGALNISGTGRTFEYKSGHAPWDKYAKNITSIVVSEGVTHLLAGTFDELDKVVSLTLPSTIEEIHTTADMPALENIIIPPKTDLHYVIYSFADESLWYQSHADGSLVYFGSFLFGYKGSLSEDVYTLEIPEGTTAVGNRAFISQSQITDIKFPDSLKYIGNHAFYGTGWYNNQPDGLVYAGNVALKWKGPMVGDETEVILKNGTKGIAEYAFSAESAASNNDKITAVTIPATVEEIGDSAFWGCDDLLKVVFEDGCSLRKIHDSAFYQCDMTSFEIPETVVEIGDYAFGATKLRSIYIPSGVLMLDGAFKSASSIERFEVSADNPNYCSDVSGVLFNKDKTILHFYPGGNRREEYTVPKGVLYIADCAFAGSNLRSLNFNDELQATGTALFSNSYITKLDFGAGLKTIRYQLFTNTNLKELVIPPSIKTIEHRAFDIGTFKNIYFLNEDVCFEGDSVYSSYYKNKIVFHCYTNSTAHKHAEEYGITYVLFDDVHYTVKIDELIDVAEGIYRPNYTDESLMELDAVLNEIDLEAEGLTQYQIDEWCERLETAIKNLKIKSADFSKVDAAIKKAEAVDRSLYTDESLLVLDDAIASVDRTVIDSQVISDYAKAIEDAISKLSYKPADFSVIESVMLTVNSIDRRLYTEESLAELDKKVAEIDYNLTVDNQSKVTQWATEIETAVKNLKYLPADYSAVEREIEKARKIDRRFYSEISLIALDAAINSVNYNLDITRQQEVDAFASAIADAVSALQYASIALRHEACGVVVSATTKEIKPDTVLAVEEVDPSNYEGTNFAVGGSIRSLSFYDINLVYETVIVQPDGTVTVKIKLKDGVDPLKCKVYHVTEDVVNPLVRFANTIDGNYVVFETNHFSEFAVIEVETVLDSIDIVSSPAQTEYFTAETLDLSGLKIVAHYSDGTSSEISDYNVSMVDMNTAGNKNVIVYYTFGGITKSAGFEIVVSNRTYSDKEFSLREPSITQINYGDSIWLNVNFEGVLPDKTKIVWTQSNNNFEVVEVSENGMSCKITPLSNGETVFTVSLVDENGKVLATDTQGMTSKAGVWQKIVAFFKKMFGLTKTYLQECKTVFLSKAT